MQTIDRKLLIVKPPYRHIPVGMAYVLACLEHNNIPFDFIDATFRNPDYNNLLKKNDYFAFATGGLIANFRFMSQTIKEIRSIKPSLPIILGGNITKDANPELLFCREMMGMDFGIIGEAETTLPYLCEKLITGSNDLKEIPGLFYKDKSSGEIIKNYPKRLDLESFNILPAWHNIDINYYKYSDVSYMARQKVLPVLTGRGCVGACTFCSPSIGAFRKRPIEYVMQEIESLFSKYNFDILQILNEMFYQDSEDILRFCIEYKKLKTNKPWMCCMRIDLENVDDDLFVAMKEAGCILIGVGIESGSDKVLEIMKKQITRQQTVNFLRSAKKASLPFFGTFMIGNEGENEEDIKETIDMVINEEMNTDASLTHAYPGTQIYRNALNKGLIKNEKEYYENVIFAPGSYDITWRNRERYLNVSDIPDALFWKVIFTECRRFYTFMYKRFIILNIKYKLNFITNRIRAVGVCSECGSPIRISTFLNFLGQLTYCPKCYRGLYLDYYKLKRFSRHFEILCNELGYAKKLVIVGVELQAMNILRYDHFGLDYGKIKGFLQLEEDKESDSLFAYLPRLRIEALIRIMPDTILIADDPHGDAALKLRIFYVKNKLVIPKILYLVADKKILLRLSRFRLILKSILKLILKRIFGASFIQRVRLFYLRYGLR